MNRFPLALIALSLAAAGCTDADPTTGTTPQTLESECTGGIPFNGQWPAIQKWSGKAPEPVAEDQYFVIAPIEGDKKSFLAIQADWKSGKITWAVKLSGSSERAQALATLSVEPGNIDALGGTRGPIKWPPGTEEGQWVIDRGFRSYEPWED